MFGFVNDDDDSDDEEEGNNEGGEQEQITGEDIAGAMKVEDKSDQEMVQKNIDDDRDPYMLELENAEAI